MKIIAQTVGTHFLIMVVYMMLGLTLRMFSFGVIILLPLHVGYCLVASIVFYIGSLANKEERGEILVMAHANLLSAIVVAIVGSSACTNILFHDFSH